MKAQQFIGRAILATAASTILLSAPGTVSATPYYYRGNAYTAESGITGVNRVIAIIDADQMGVYSWIVTAPGISGASDVFSDQDVTSGFLMTGVFDVTINGVGNVTAWNIYLHTDIPDTAILNISSDYISGDSASTSADPVYCPSPTSSCPFVNESGQVSSPGVWLQTPFAVGVPEPATWAMLLAGFGGLGGIMRRRRAATSAVA